MKLEAVAGDENLTDLKGSDQFTSIRQRRHQIIL